MSHLERKLLTRNELAQALSVSTKTVSRLQSKGLPSVEFPTGGRRFDYEDVLTWLKQRETSETAA